MGLAQDADGFGLLWGNRVPLLITSDGGARWTTASVADGDVRMVRAAEAWTHGRVVWDRTARARSCSPPGDDVPR